MLFGQQPSTNPAPNLFGNLNPTPQSSFGGGLLGQQQPSQSQPAQSPQQAGGLFGGFGANTLPQQQPLGGGLFGQTQNQQQPAKTVFGGQATNQQQQAGGLFGAQPQQQQQTGGLFGASATGTTQQAAGNAWGQSWQNPAQPQNQSPGIFNQTNPQQQPQQQAQGGLFSTQPQQAGLFGAQQNQQAGGGWFNQSSPQGQQQQPQQTWGGFGQQQQQQPPQTPGFGFMDQNSSQLNSFQCKMLDKTYCKREETGSGSSKIFLAVNCITMMPQFKDKSVKELRNEDYKQVKTGQVPDDLKQLLMANNQYQTGQMNQQQFSSMFATQNNLVKQQSPQQQSGGFFQPQNQLQQNQQQQGLFGATSNFQNKQQQQPSAGGLFGSTQQQQPGAGAGLLGAFGSTQPQQNTGFFNQQPQQQQQQQTGLLGGFGQTQGTGLGGLFGGGQQQQQQQPQQQNTLFGASTASTTGGGLFGSTQQPQQQQQSAFGGLFSNPQQQPQQQQTGFNFGGIGQKTSQPQQQNQLFGAVGSINTSNTAPTGGLFQQNQQSQQKPGGLFGATQAPAFGQAAQPTLFGSTQQAQPQQTGLGGLFSTPQQNQPQQQQQGGLFGSAFGQPQQQQQQQQPQQQQGLFNFGQPQATQQQQPQQTAGLFGQPQQQVGLGLGSSQPQQQPQLSFGLPQQQPLQAYGFGQPQPQQPNYQQQSNIVFDLPKMDWSNHYQDFFGQVQGSDSYNQQQADLSKFKNVQEYFDFQQYQMKYNPFSECYSSGDMLFKEPMQLPQFKEYKMKSKSKLENSEDILEIANLLRSQNTEQADNIEINIKYENKQISLHVSKDSSVPEVKKRALKEYNLNETNQLNYQLFSNNEFLPENTKIDWGVSNIIEIALQDQQSSQFKNCTEDEFNCSKSEFATHPPLFELYRMSSTQLSNVKHFKISNEYGEISFQQAVDLRGVDLSELVHISLNCIEVYAGKQEEKPCVGKGLNVPAVLTYYQIKRPANIAADKFLKRIKRIAKKNQVQFESFNEETNILVIRAEHF